MFYISIPNLNRIDAVFQKLLSGHQILMTDGRTHGRTNARTGVTLNAPPPFFEWRGHKKDVRNYFFCLPKIWCNSTCRKSWCNRFGCCWGGRFLWRAWLPSRTHHLHIFVLRVWWAVLGQQRGGATKGECRHSTLQELPFTSTFKEICRQTEKNNDHFYDNFSVFFYFLKYIFLNIF